MYNIRRWRGSSPRFGWWWRQLYWWWKLFGWIFGKDFGIYRFLFTSFYGFRIVPLYSIHHFELFHFEATNPNIWILVQLILFFNALIYRFLNTLTDILNLGHIFEILTNCRMGEFGPPTTWYYFSLPLKYPQEKDKKHKSNLKLYPMRLFQRSIWMRKCRIGMLFTYEFHC